MCVCVYLFVFERALLYVVIQQMQSPHFVGFV